MAERLTIDITPDTSILPKLGKTGYSVIEALSELVDNSIDARLPGKLLAIRITMNEREYIVEDNAAGMDGEQLAGAMRLGFSQKEGKLGSFGLGLKTACTSLGQHFSITTTPHANGSTTYQIEFDEEEWNAAESWQHSLTRTDNPTPMGHGTKITITHPKVFYGNAVTNARREFGQRYYPFLQDGTVEIHVNGKACVADPPRERWREHFELRLSDGNVVRGWLGSRVEGNSSENGFHLYKNGRLISMYKAVGYQRHPDLRTLIGELHLDHLPVTHTKREFIEADKSYQLFAKEFHAFLEPFRAKLREESRGGEEGSPRIRGKAVASLGRMSTAINVTSVAGSLAKSDEKDFIIKTRGKEFPFTFRLRKLADDEPKRILVDDTGIQLTINTDHALYQNSKSKEFLAVLYIAETIAEEISGNRSYQEIKTLRDYLLRSAYDKVLDKSDHGSVLAHIKRVATSYKLEAPAVAGAATDSSDP